MTQHEFDLLPGLLTPRQFQAATGLGRHKMRELRESKRLGVKRLAVNCVRYFKHEAAEWSGFKVN